MLTHIRSLGSIFFAFAGGGVIGTSTNIVSSAFLGDDFPRSWPLLLASFLMLLAASALLCYLAIILAELENALSGIPRSLGHKDSEVARRDLIKPQRLRTYLTLVSSFLLTVAGLMVLPLRIYLIKKYGWV